MIIIIIIIIIIIDMIKIKKRSLSSSILTTVKSRATCFRFFGK